MWFLITLLSLFTIALCIAFFVLVWGIKSNKEWSHTVVDWTNKHVFRMKKRAGE